ncbi:hypothetical protein [Mucilaginibacter aquaedulcis]|uniref:hypothetical protein n=1 Tax=Mucilaginibacter aquaedulcis TaxID=1187081 RepID=UPI0025B4E639|nr:hypothetical protein [Mucilaginibacter aquaedulcis]MDN3547443.1 hypothetical protein [Mucilaginibacter aquaedulcis]
MFGNLFKYKPPLSLSTFLNYANTQNWNYLSALDLKSNDLQKATFDQILSNPGDIAIGVNKVEMVFGKNFFNLFHSLIIKHHDDGTIRLMFNEEVLELRKVLDLFERLRINLGEGIHYSPKYSTFFDTGKVMALSNGRYDSKTDEILHYWQNGRFGFTLNYKIDPLRELVFIVTYSKEKTIDIQIRKKGTLINLLNHNINELLNTKETYTKSIIEDGNIKFIDYIYQVNPPEFHIFESITIRLVGKEKSKANTKSLLVTYGTKQQPDSSSVIQLVDKLVNIYGVDSSGYAEMQAHEIDIIDEDSYWIGRSWFINQNHGLQNIDDPEQLTLYWLTLSLNPEDGFYLSILGFDEMENYHKQS